ncbi:hypothetical protein [Paenibacillus medicaginis]|uniref:Uncharacterized protein n=1 Tax=Paenibacillus medicaginis TaxID=1470560 RepID=A0ABV5BUN2_9BACL
MQAINSENVVQFLKPRIEYDEKGKLKIEGICWISGDNLDCYEWEDEDMLWILDTIPASEDSIPVDQYYCFNVNQNDCDWVTKDQVKFSLELTQ